MQTKNEKLVMYSCIVHCRVRCKAVKSDSSKKKGPAIPLLHTLGVYQSIGEGAAQCCESDQQRWQLIHLPSLSHHLHWVKRASQDGAGLLDKFIKSPPVCCWDAAAPADFSIENGWCHHRVIESSQECPLHSKGPELPKQMESALKFIVRCWMWSVQSGLLFMWTPRHL